MMNEKLVRVGTTYIPVSDLESSTEWYQEKLGATLSYMDEQKAIINLAHQSFFLVKAQEGETANFTDYYGNERFSLTFEVDGEDALEKLHSDLQNAGVRLKQIEDRGHPGRNFVFYDPDGNCFDVWSGLSPEFKRKFLS